MQKVDIGMAVKLPKFGCYVLVVQQDAGDVTLFKMAIKAYENATVETWTQVTAPQSQKFLDAVNDRYDTNFQMYEFTGR